MDSVDRLLKTIRGVSKTKPVTQLQLSEIIRRLWSDQGKIIQIIYNEIINNTTNIYQSITQIILAEKGVKITQTAHGFIVGDVIKPADPLWIKAKADTEANAKATAIVSEIIDDDNFKYIQGGLLAGDYTTGAKYLLSITTAGAVFIQSDPEIWTAGNYRQMIGTGTADGLLVEIDEGNLISSPSVSGASAPTTVSSSSGNTDNGTNHTHALDDVVTAKTVNFATITIDAKGRVTAASSGSPQDSRLIYYDTTFGTVSDYQAAQVLAYLGNAVFGTFSARVRDSSGDLIGFIDGFFDFKGTRTPRGVVSITMNTASSIVPTVAMIETGTNTQLAFYNNKLNPGYTLRASIIIYN